MSGEEGGDNQPESGSEEKLKRRQTFHEERKAAHKERHQVQEEQRRVQVEQRMAQQEQRRAQQEQKRAQEEQRRVQEQQRRGSPAVPVRPAAPAAPIGGGSLAGIWPGGNNASTTTPAPATTTTATAAPQQLNHPGLDPNEFRDEIRLLTNMGFADTSELRTVVRDFGGEVEAVVEFMISAGRQ
ncbi:hypothetical protein BGX23_004593 [Mortierella sp. AD031]|nr:hypothetical protein BGX23_004593 [Mortierella sp. AD031]